MLDSYGEYQFGPCSRAMLPLPVASPDTPLPVIFPIAQLQLELLLLWVLLCCSEAILREPQPDMKPSCTTWYLLIPMKQWNYSAINHLQ